MSNNVNKVNILIKRVENQKIEYRGALRKVDNGKYEDIIKFYYYKICDSIFELTNLDKNDINEVSIKKLEII